MESLKKFMASGPVTAVVAAGCAVCLAVILMVAGMKACTLDVATESLSQQYSNAALSPFSQEQLTRAALAGKEYSFDTNCREDLDEVIDQINAELGYPHPYDQRYYLTEDAISHLDDVYRVQELATWLLMAAALIGIAGFAHLRYYGRDRAFAWAHIVGGGSVLALFACAGIAALVDFNGLFTLFHSLFFAEGTWTFSYDSLLICMYPESFWVGMGAIWLAVTAVLSILFVLGGLHTLRRHPKESK